MLKHPDLTLRRIDLFLKTELEEHLLGARVPLQIEYCEVAHATQNEAKKGPWKVVEKGFRYGPAYRTVWFRLTGRVPAELANEPLGVVAEVGSERTVWKDNAPWRGVDVQHYVFPYSEAAGVVPFDTKGSRKVEIYIQAYTRNAQVRVHLREPEREPLVEEVDRAELVVVDREISDLRYDVAFTRNLHEALEGDESAQATLLRAMNEVCNTFDREKRPTIARCRRVLKEALSSLPGEVKHTLTPVGHAHLDTAWLWPLEITRKKMAHTTATQLALMEEYPEYVFVHSQASQYEWLEKEYPSLFERVKKQIAKGQWEVVGSMWVEADCNLTGAESMVRQFLYGKRYFRDKLGVETEDMWLPDVFGYSAALPQILAKFNVDYFLTQKICWNQTNKFPHHTFWWQGIDGSKIWSHFPPADTYCADCTPVQILKSMRNYRDHARSDHSLYVFGFGDGGGGPTEQHLEFLKRARHAPGLPEIEGGAKALDFFREAKAQSKDLMTWVGELYLEIHRGTYTSQAANKRGNRFSEFLLRDAELLACFRERFPRTYPAAELEEAWKLVLLNQFHDIIPGSSVREVYEESDRDYAKIMEIGERVVRESLEQIGAKFDTQRHEKPLALFQNATTTTEGSVPWPKGDAPGALVCGDEELPVQLVEGFGDRRVVFQTPTDALGAVAVAHFEDEAPAAKSRLRARSRRIENDEFAVRFDSNGNITSIQNLEDGSEYVEPGKLANCFQLFDDKPLFWSAWDIDAYALETGVDLVKSDSFEIVERGPVRVAVEIVKRFGKSTLRQRISLGPTPGIRFDTEVDWHEEDKLLKVAFPVNVNSSRATYEIQFGSVERPTHDNTSWDVAKFEVCAQKWADLSEGDHGVALLNDCKYGHDIKGNVMRLSLLRAPKAPDPLCDMGTHLFTYVLTPHFGPHHYAGVVASAYALNAPLRHAWLKSNAGELGNLPPFVACDDRNIVVETVKKAEADGAIVVRLYECHNARGAAELFCARTPKAAWLCDMEENKLSELEVHDGMVLFDYKPFEIHTIRLEV
ncbi:MAG: glycosyl hydrolase-related protein [Fimbriimonadaceae bacterium]|nr:alpha-mannosidase [Chthonomonadaceae bacterium]MCO5295551.1 glycosyl hydrolase-related protein [Fimbriimonadaceae bacterium]